MYNGRNKHNYHQGTCQNTLTQVAHEEHEENKEYADNCEDKCKKKKGKQGRSCRANSRVHGEGLNRMKIPKQ